MLQFNAHSKGGNHSHDYDRGAMSPSADDGDLAFTMRAGDETWRKRQVEGKLKNDLSRAAQKLYDSSTDDLQQDQLVLCEIWAEIKKMKSEVFSELKSLAAHPTEEVFMTQSMEKKIDGIFQSFANTTNKLELDLEHKPYFVDENPAFIDVPGKRYSINGEHRDLTEDEYVQRRQKEGENYRNHWYEVLHDENYNYPSEALLVYIIIVISILISVLTTMLSTVPKWKEEEDLWFTIELVVTICFTIEYIAKIIFVRNKLKYIRQPMNVLDFLAIVPFYITEAMGEGDGPIASISGVLRALRLTRIAKIRQLATPYTNIILRAMIDSVLGTGSAVGIFLFIGCVFTGTLVYAAEEGEDSGFDSIPKGMWFAVVTMTTVGYGDLYPTSFMGYMLGTFTILCGLILMSLIIMVIGQYYIIHLEIYEGAKNEIKKLLYEKAREEKRSYLISLGKDKDDVGTRAILKQYKKNLNTKSFTELYKSIATNLRKSNEKRNQ